MLNVAPSHLMKLVILMLRSVSIQATELRSMKIVDLLFLGMDIIVEDYALIRNLEGLETDRVCVANQENIISCPRLFIETF